MVIVAVRAFLFCERPLCDNLRQAGRYIRQKVTTRSKFITLKRNEIKKGT